MLLEKMLNAGFEKIEVSSDMLEQSYDFAQKLLEQNMETEYRDAISLYSSYKEVSVFRLKAEVAACSIAIWKKLAQDIWAERFAYILDDKKAAFQTLYELLVDNRNYCDAAIFDNIIHEDILKKGDSPKFSRYVSSFLTLEGKNYFGSIWKKFEKKMSGYVFISSLPHHLVGISAFSPKNKRNLEDIFQIKYSDSAVGSTWIDSASGSSCQDVFNSYDQVWVLPTLLTIDSSYVIFTALEDNPMTALFQSRCVIYAAEHFFFTQKVYGNYAGKELINSIFADMENLFYNPKNYRSTVVVDFKQKQQSKIGYYFVETKTCRTCDGSGSLQPGYIDGDGHFNHTHDDDCHECEGSGEIEISLIATPYNDYSQCNDYGVTLDMQETSYSYPNFSDFNIKFRVSKRYLQKIGIETEGMYCYY